MSCNLHDEIRIEQPRLEYLQNGKRKFYPLCLFIKQTKNLTNFQAEVTDLIRRYGGDSLELTGQEQGSDRVIHLSLVPFSRCYQFAPHAAYLASPHRMVHGVAFSGNANCDCEQGRTIRFTAYAYPNVNDCNARFCVLR